MNKDSIITLPNPSLRTKSTKIKLFDDNLKKLVQDMCDATLDWEASRPHEFGVALAAVQVNELQRVVIIREDFEDKKNIEFTVFVNPQIIRGEGEMVYRHEGCLSIKDVYGMVPRYPKIKIKAQDLDGQEFRLTTEGFSARVLQHEIDHTNGVVFIDHIKDQEDAFFRLSDDDGKLESLDYEEHIKNSSILWQ